MGITVMVPSGQKIEVDTSSWDDPTITSRPVTYEGESVVFNPRSMTQETPYTFKFLGYWWSVVKHLDGSMDFYYIPLSRSGTK